MSQGMNKVFLFGNLGADPDLKVTQQGTAILNLRLATTESYVDRNNERKEHTEWHYVVLWGKRGESLSRFLRKGDRILVEGSLRTETYEKNGEKRYTTKINASNVLLCGGGKGNDDSGERPTRAAPSSKREPSSEHEKFNSDSFGGDDDIPF